MKVKIEQNQIIETPGKTVETYSFLLDGKRVFHINYKVEGNKVSVL